MRKIGIVLTLVCASLLSGIALAQLPSKPYLVGVWEGNMTVMEDREGNPMLPPFAAQQPFRLDIRETNLVMYFPTGDPSNPWLALGEGADLRLNQAERSAIVIAQVGQNPTVTMMLNIVRWDEQNLTVYMSRVTGGEMPAAFGAMGQMKRVSGGG